MVVVGVVEMLLLNVHDVDKESEWDAEKENVNEGEMVCEMECEELNDVLRVFDVVGEEEGDIDKEGELVIDELRLRVMDTDIEFVEELEKLNVLDREILIVGDVLKVNDVERLIDNEYEKENDVVIVPLTLHDADGEILEDFVPDIVNVLLCVRDIDVVCVLENERDNDRLIENVCVKLDVNDRDNESERETDVALLVKETVFENEPLKLRLAETLIEVD